MRSLRGKTAVITGAASGIGRALAERLARERMHLVLADVDHRTLREVARGLPGVAHWSDWIYYVQCHALRKEAEGLLRTAGLRKAPPG